MKTPIGFVEVLLKNLTASEVEAASANGRAIMEALIAGEREMRLSNQNSKALGECRVVSDVNRTAMPQLSCWAICSDDAIRFFPSKDIHKFLLHSSKMTLGIPLLESHEDGLLRDVFFGTPAACVLSELLFEAGLIGQLNERDQPPFSIDEVCDTIEQIFGMSEVIILTGSAKKAFYSQAKHQLALSPEGKAIFEKFEPFGVSEKSGVWSNILKKLF